jgi:hypothetical protein
MSNQEIGADRALVASDQAAARLAPSGFDHGERFTPGPWKVFRASNGKLLGIGDAEAGGITDSFGGLWRSGKEMDANADLIAAAPELYAALTKAIDDATGKPNSWFYLAKDALAKARGEA